MNMIWVGFAVVVAIGFLVAVSYNRFATQTALMANSWANVDTELRRRHDLVPNLVETVQGYAGHEQRVLVDVTEARSAARGRNRHRCRAQPGRAPRSPTRCTRSSRWPRPIPS